MGYPGPIAERAIELLADCEWHDYDEVIRKISIVVPPAVAVRKAEYSRSWIASKRGFQEGGRQRQRPVEELIRIGSAIVARDVLANKRRFEHDPPLGSGSRRDNRSHWRVRLKD